MSPYFSFLLCVECSFLYPCPPHLPTYLLFWLSLSAAEDCCSLLTMISIDLASQGSPNSHPSEELLKQPDYSDKIKQMLGNHQGQPGAGGGSLQ